MLYDIGIKRVGCNFERGIIEGEKREDWYSVFLRKYGQIVDTVPFPDEALHRKYNLFLVIDDMSKLKKLKYNIYVANKKLH